MDVDNHTGNDRRLWLERKKPLSMFYYSKANDDKGVLPIEDFLPHVEDGSMTMEEFDIGFPSSSGYAVITYVLYAARGEEWRIPAMELVLAAQRDNLHSPDEGIDRIIGMLLGYSKESIDEFVRQGILAKTYGGLNLPA